MVVVVHGGAGDWADDDELRIEARAGCERAAATALKVLVGGGAALDAVEAAVVVLEEDPSFNAGRGACLTRAGTIELDAGIMDGRALRFGGVGAVPPVRSAIRLARKVLEAGDAALLVGDGALEFARENGVELCGADELMTERARRHWMAGAKPLFAPDSRGGTVGAVALDGQGHVAAATSTGGRAHKREGRVGDTALVGAGTCADDELGAASATGNGEHIIRNMLTRHALHLVRAGLSPEEGARGALQSMLERTGGDGGLIIVVPDGRVGVAHTTRAMPYAVARKSGGESGISRTG